MIRRNRMAMSAIGGMAVALMLAGCGAQGTPEALPSRAAADGAAPPVDVPLPGTGVDGLPAPEEPAQGNGGNAAPTDSSVTLIAKDVPKMGRVVTDEEGWTLYRFDKDTIDPAKSNCDGECEQKWPPVLTEGTPVLQGINPSLVGTVVRSDGKQQVTLGGWPLYTFAADGAPGKWKGQAAGNAWWVVDPEGKRNLSCLPEGAEPPGGDKGDEADEDVKEGKDEGDGGYDEGGAAEGGDTGGGYDY